MVSAKLQGGWLSAQIVGKVTVRGVLPERTANADPVENSMIAKSDRKKDLENNFIVKFNF